MSPKKTKAKPKKTSAAKKSSRARPKKAMKKTTRKPAARKAGKAAKKPVKKATRKAAKKVTKRPSRKPVQKAVKKAPAKAAKKAPEKATTKTAARKKRTTAPPVKTLALKSKPAAAAASPAPVEAKKPRTKKPRRRSSRRANLIRRGPDGEILAPGDLLLPGGAQGAEEIEYMFRGSMAAEHPAAEDAINEVLAKRGVPEAPGQREELQGTIEWAQQRFGEGDVEPITPVRGNLKKTFQGVVERARQRRREIGAFLRGLDMGHTETSHMDAHGEESLQSLMEWAARLENLVENLAETPEMNQAHYTQFHRVLDQLEATTEALIIDVEQTLRRLRDRRGS
jgi:hypothetical protein